MNHTIIYDFETSGLNPFHDDITEIGCKCIETDKEFTCLLKPLSNRLLNKKNMEITGITNKMLSESGLPTMKAYCAMFDYLLEHYHKDSTLSLIAHNGRSFDDIFLKRAHRYLQENGNHTYDEMMNDIVFIDSLLLSRLVHPERYSHSMKSMCTTYNITNEAEHRAMGDVNALCNLWGYLTQQIKAKGLSTDTKTIQKLLFI
jgi:DNA polymerase-3 subunit epsilon